MRLATLDEIYEAPSFAVEEQGRWRLQTTVYGFTNERVFRVYGAAVIAEDVNPPGSTAPLGCP
jgi:hypothetical protein